MLPGPFLSPSYCNTLRKYVGVKFLNNTAINVPAEGKTRICEIEAQVINYLHRLGMRDTEIFGLALENDGEFMFVKEDEKVSRYASRQWKESANGLDPSGNHLLMFEYRVKCYVESQLLVRDHVARLHYYLQLRENVLRFGQPLRIEVAIHLTGFALQSDVGNFCPEKHQGAYFNPCTYVPQWIIDQVGVAYIIEAATGLHRKNEGLSPSDAQAQFIREASQSEAPHNIHLYKLRRKKHDPASQIDLSICDKGMGIYEEEGGGPPSNSKKLVQVFPWSSISDLSFDKKKFEIRAHGYPGKLTFYTSTDEKSRHLLSLCRVTHQFSRLQRPRACELRSSSYDRRRHRDSYAYPEYPSMGDQSLPFGGDFMGSRNDQRVSICSNSSSNAATSGLSERILSLEESEEIREGESSVGQKQILDIGLGRGIDRSLSMNSNRTDTSDTDDKGQCRLHPSESSSPWEALTRGDSTGLGRAESIHSSSSQQSSSTVRSRYSLSHSLPLHRPEFTLGAELADLSLAPDLPELADLPAMTTDIVQEGEDIPDSVSHLHTTHNCCSTCCDEAVSIASDGDDNEVPEDGEVEEDACHCGSCRICLLKSNKNGLSSESGLFLDYGKSSEMPPDLYHGNAAFTSVSDDSSVVVQPDLDDTLASNYNFSEEDFSQLGTEDSYLEYYKEGMRYAESLQSSLENSNQQNILGDSLEMPRNRSPVIVKRSSPKGIASLSRSQNSSPVHDEQSLDYSVESAHASLAVSYPNNRNFLAWALLASSQNAMLPENSNNHSQPSSVPMSKVTTVTPVNIASSKFNEASNTDIKPPSYPSHSKAIVSTPDAVISETAVACSSEAPAKFITSKPRITILKAHTQLAATTAPSFTSVPLTRSQVHTLPQVQIRPKVDPVQSLQRIALPDARPLGLPPMYKENLMSHHSFINLPLHQIPVIRKNNYLDVHASSNLNREKFKGHPEQLPSKQPRSLYLKNQKKRLQQQQMQEKHQKEKMHQQIMNETVYQPSAYAQGVGVPLLPPPTFIGCSGNSRTNSRRTNTQNSLFHKSSPNLCQQSGIEQPCYTFQQCPQQSDSSSHQNFIYQPHIKNFFQNPPPPTPHPGFGVGACPNNQPMQVYPESLSPTYQCVSDPGTYPISMQNQHHSQQSLQSVLATVYTNQVTQSQIEQFKAQLNSDTDYVIYPHKDPAISRQEYMDAKQGQFIASRAQKNFDYQQHTGNNSSLGFVPMPPPYRSPKSSLLYRSTPNVAVSLSATGALSSYPSYQSLASQGSTHQPGSSSGYSSMARGRYFSQQSLASSSSSVPSGYSASTQSLTGSFDPYAEQSPLPSSPTAVMRVRSDESILSSSVHTEDETGSLPPSTVHLQHPPYRPKEVLNHSGEPRRGLLPKRVTGRSESSATSTRAVGRARSRSRPRVTLQQVRECGNQLDVPFLAALCSDSSLTPKQDGTRSKKPAAPLPSEGTPTTSSAATASPTASAANAAAEKAKVDADEEETAGVSLRYSLSGIYTTNQFPAAHVNVKSSKVSNGVHEHPKPMSSKQQLRLQLFQAGGKLKHSRSLKEPAQQYPS